jgi:hypothetical protein
MTGVVTFHAGATGEVLDDNCQCWVWGGGSDNGSAIVTIVDTIWKEFLLFSSTDKTSVDGTWQPAYLAG